MIMKRMLTSCFGLGFLPIAPGTWGSLPPAIIFGLLHFLGVSAVSIFIVMVVLAIAGIVICVRVSPSIIAITGKSDPGEVVADEVAGQAVTFLFAGAIAGEKVLIISVIGFLLFRLFDILKPWPIRKLEKLRDGWGIVADDILAGVYAGIVLLVFVKYW